MKSTLFHLNQFRTGPNNRITTLTLPNALFSGATAKKISLRLTKFNCQGQIKMDLSRASVTIKTNDGETRSISLDSKQEFNNISEFCSFLGSATESLLEFKGSNPIEIIPATQVDMYSFSASLCPILGLPSGAVHSGKLSDLEVDLFGQFRQLGVVCYELENNCFCNQSQFGVLAFLTLSLAKKGKITNCAIDASPSDCLLQSIPNLSSLSFKLISLASPELTLPLHQVNSLNLTLSLNENPA